MTQPAPLSAIAFYARDFLAEEFSRLGAALTGEAGERPRFYIVSKQAEAEQVRANDPAGRVFVLGDYLAAAEAMEPVRDERFHALAKLVRRDRYVARMDLPKIATILQGLKLLEDALAQAGPIALLLDEPVSGIVNDALDRFVTAQGGLGAHFNVGWVPGHIWFARGAMQDRPIALNLLDDGAAKVAAHIAQRKRDAGLPAYLHNYRGVLRPLKAAAKYGAMGMRRRMVKAETFLDADPWPHDFMASSLAASITAKYDDPKDIAASGAKCVIYPLHYEPEAVISYWSSFTNQLALAMEAFEHLPADTYLLLKEHPSQPGALQQDKWQDLLANARVKRIHGTVKMADLLAGPSALVSIGSTAVLETVMHGRPAFVVGQPHFRRMPGVTPVDDWNNFAVDWDAQGQDSGSGEEALQSWYGDFLNRHCVEGQFMRGRTDIPRAGEMIDRLLQVAAEEGAAS